MTGSSFARCSWTPKNGCHLGFQAVVSAFREPMTGFPATVVASAVRVEASPERPLWVVGVGGEHDRLGDEQADSTRHCAVDRFTDERDRGGEVEGEQPQPRRQHGDLVALPVVAQITHDRVGFVGTADIAARPATPVQARDAARHGAHEGCRQHDVQVGVASDRSRSFQQDQRVRKVAPTLDEDGGLVHQAPRQQQGVAVVFGDVDGAVEHADVAGETGVPVQGAAQRLAVVAGFEDVDGALEHRRPVA